MKKSLITCLLLSLLISACAPAAVAANTVSTSPAAPTTEPQPAEPQPAVTAANVPANTVLMGTPTSIPPAPDRQKPEDWREWPVIPVPSARARQIYQQGIAAGTDQARLSKVGDCQAIQEVLLGRYDKPSGFILRVNPENLSQTIQQFSGSFGRDGEAVQGGFNAASELSPLWSNPQTCDPGETPLACEVRVHNPSIILISLEVWWDGRSPDVYEKNMRQIIDFAISKGVLPILSTKADNVEGDHSINLATARLAYEYDLPLWNWWLAAQSLPNRGLDPDRPDGFHISLDAWDERSFTALQAIDSVWRGVTQTVEEPAAAEALLQPASPLFAPDTSNIEQNAEVCSLEPQDGQDCGEPGALPLLSPPADPAWMSDAAGVILFSTAIRAGEVVTPQGVFMMNPVTGSVSQLLPVGTNLQAVSPDGRQILYSRGRDLILALVDGSQQGIINTRFVDRGARSAGWQVDGKALLFLTEENGSPLLAKYPLDGSTVWQRLSAAGETPLEIYPAADASRVFWQAGECVDTGACVRTGVRASVQDGSTLEYLAAAQKAAFSPDGKWMVYEQQAAENSLLTLASMDQADLRTLGGLGNNFLDYSWSPDGSRLSILTIDRSEYSGQWMDVRNLIISPADMGTKILPPAAGINTRPVWSPDGANLLLTGTLDNAGGSRVHAQVMDVSSGVTRNLPFEMGAAENEFLYTTRVFWVKPIQ